MGMGSGRYGCELAQNIYRLPVSIANLGGVLQPRFKNHEKGIINDYKGKNYGDKDKETFEGCDEASGIESE